MSSPAPGLHAVEPAALPSDAILVHMGLRKTGTTAIQSLLADAREDLKPMGVLYPGNAASHHVAARSLIGRPDYRLARAKRTVPTLKSWEDLVAEAHACSSRVIISSEFLSYARPEHVQRLVDDIGRDRLHILVGIRNLAPVALSSWQQDLKTAAYVWGLDRWLEDNFRRTPAEAADGSVPKRSEDGSSFWELSDPGEVIERWVAAAGAKRVSVMVMSEGDRTQLPRTFERLLDLPEGVLGTRQVSAANRSMTGIEAELVRQINQAVRSQLDWPEYTSLIRYGMVNRIIESRTPAKGEAKATLPAWASAQAADEGRRAADRIGALGVAVIGDLGDMAKEVSRGADDSVPPAADTVPMDAAVEAALGVALRAVRDARLQRGKRRKPKPAAPQPKTPTVDELGTKALAAALAARWRASARKQTSDLKHRLTSRGSAAKR